MNAQNYLYAFLPFGSADIDYAISILKEADIDPVNFSEYLFNFIDQANIKYADIDICASVLEYILEKSRNEIKSLTSKDFCNDLPNNNIYVYCNYLNSSFDKTDITKNFIDELIKKDKNIINNFSPILKYFYDNL